MAKALNQTKQEKRRIISVGLPQPEPWKHKWLNMDYLKLKKAKRQIFLFILISI